jgi:glutathione S-transferase
MADAMYAPVCTRFITYGVHMDPVSKAYCDAIMTWPAMAEWIEVALTEPDELEEVDAEF